MIRSLLLEPMLIIMALAAVYLVGVRRGRKRGRAETWQAVNLLMALARPEKYGAKHGAEAQREAAPWQ